jgi:hypothetical protein
MENIGDYPDPFPSFQFDFLLFLSLSVRADFYWKWLCGSPWQYRSVHGGLGRSSMVY